LHIIAYLHFAVNISTQNGSGIFYCNTGSSFLLRQIIGTLGFLFWKAHLSYLS
jgi:hypothetical protein